MSHVIKRAASGLAEFVAGSFMWVVCTGAVLGFILLVVGTLTYIFTGGWL